MLMDRSNSLVKSLTRKESHKTEAFIEPTVPTLRLHMTQSALVIAGIVQKYVNFGKGWRARLFILENGVLRYYKIYGPTAVDVGKILHTLNQRAEVTTIGARTHLENNRGASGTFEQPVPHGEIHLQVSSTRASSSDSKKFYVHSGTKTLQVRAETSEDRSAWVEALNGAKALWNKYQEAGSTVSTNHDDDSGVSELGGGVERVLERLAVAGAAPDLTGEVRDLFVQQQRLYQDFARQEAGKRQVLLEYVKQVEEDKRRLETQVVQEGVGLSRTVSGRVTTQEGVRPAVLDDTYSETAPQDHDSDDEVDNDEAQQRSDDDVLWQDALEEDVNDVQPPSGLRSREGSLHGTSFTSTLPLRPTQSLEASPASLSGASSAALPTTQRPPSAAATPQLPSPDTTSIPHTPHKVSEPTSPPTPPTANGNQISVPAWLKSEAVVPRRDRLPQPATQERPVSLWQLIKGVVGKDLTRVCLPVYFNEPLSALQKCAEDLEYSELLDEAAKHPAGSMERLIQIAAFAVSGYAGTLGRTCKPFNPLLGETFEMVYPEKGWRFLSEKVMHHPMIFAAAAEGRGWSVAADIDMKSKFWGRSIEVHPAGVIELKFADGEVFHWNKVVSSINNIIIGRINVTHGGVMRIRSLSSPNFIKLTFHETTFLNHQMKHVVTGHIENEAGRVPGISFHGRWDDAFRVEVDGKERLLWTITPPPEEPTRYNLSRYTIILNELTPGLKDKLAPTDSRLRPDQRFLEQGLYDDAFQWKFKLEEKQRAVRKAVEKGEEPPFRPRWFTPVEGAKQGHDVLFRYHGGYWEAREQGGSYKGCRDIYNAADIPGPSS